MPEFVSFDTFNEYYHNLESDELFELDGDYQSVKIKTRYLQLKYNEYILKNWKEFIPDFDIYKNNKPLIISSNGKKIIYNKPKPYKGALILFIGEKIQNHEEFDDYDDEDKKIILDKLLSEFEKQKDKYI